MLSVASDLDSLPDISRSETSNATEGEDGTLAGKDSETCIMWEKDFTGAKSLSIKRASLKGKIPVVEKAKHISSGVIDHGHISMYS